MSRAERIAREETAVAASLSCLVGAVVLETGAMAGDEGVYGFLKVRLSSGAVVFAVPWRDPEGNGPGFLAIEEAS